VAGSSTQRGEGVLAIDPGPLETGSEWSGTEVTVNTEVCVGAGQCVLATSEVFDQGPDGLVVLLTRTPPPSLRSAVREAARQCPSGAVTVGDGTAR
jgi:ferredoxin